MLCSQPTPAFSSVAFRLQQLRGFFNDYLRLPRAVQAAESKLQIVTQLLDELERAVLSGDWSRYDVLPLACDIVRALGGTRLVLRGRPHHGKPAGVPTELLLAHVIKLWCHG